MMDCVLSGSLLVVFSLFCYAMCVFFQANKLSLSPHINDALFSHTPNDISLARVKFKFKLCEMQNNKRASVSLKLGKAVNT